MNTPAFRVTVPMDLYRATCDAIDQPFADSYLYGATLNGPRLTPRTLTGYGKMKDRHDFMRLLNAEKITLVKPEPWPGKGDRATAADHR